MGFKNTLLILFLLNLSVQAFTQTTCKATINVKVKFCGPRLASDSTDSTCACKSCYYQIIPEAAGFEIISFTLSAGGEGFEDDIYEAPNQGAILTGQSRRIFAMIRPGSYFEIGCIKAKTKDGRIFYLQPFFMEVK